MAMCDVITGSTKRIYLSHLSRDNNMKDLARMSVGQVLNQHDIDTDKEVLLCDTNLYHLNRINRCWFSLIRITQQHFFIRINIMLIQDLSHTHECGTGLEST